MQPGNYDPVISKVTVRRHGSADVFTAQSSASDCTWRWRLCDNCLPGDTRKEGAGDKLYADKGDADGSRAYQRATRLL